MLDKDDKKTSKPILRPFRGLLAYAGPMRGQIRKATFYSILNKIFDLAPPALIGLAVDIVTRREESLLGSFGIRALETQFLVLAGATILVWVFESIFEYLSSVTWRRLSQDLQHAMRLDAYAHVQGLELRWFEDRSSGELMATLNDDINQLERFLDRGANDIIQVTTTALVIGTLYFLTIPTLAWAAVLPIPVIIFGSVLFQKLLAPRYREVRSRVGELNSRLANDLGGMPTIHAYGAEAYELDRIREESEAYKLANSRAIALSSAFSPLIRMVILASFSYMLFAGGLLVLDGGLEAGAYTTAIFLTQRLLWPLTRLGETFDLYQRAMASTARVLALLRVESQRPEGQEPAPEDGFRGEIEVRDLHYSYLPGQPVLSGMNLDIAAGTTVGIVGLTGAGKSTLLKLLLRFYKPVSGSIQLDGKDLGTWRNADLRRALAFVSQEVYLFHGTVRENIAYGNPNATQKTIERAARIAEIHSFVEGLPGGYDTLVGERGIKLSGGQRQRVSLARAILRDPPLLFLDEATSSVDNETEAAIQRSLEKLAHDRTILIVAHRLSTVRHADMIYVLDQGQVIESGRHGALLEACGAYAKLWAVQTGELPAVVARGKGRQ
jgi:ATP-binding cassette, subfamily B, bacterial